MRLVLTERSTQVIPGEIRKLPANFNYQNDEKNADKKHVPFDVQRENKEKKTRETRGKEGCHPWSYTTVKS